MSLEDVSVDFSASRLMQLSSCVESCLDNLTEDQVWARDGNHENAVGNLVLHLCGSLHEWIMVGVAGEPNTRQRDLEFSAKGGIGKNELKARLHAKVADAVAITRALDGKRLLNHRMIKGNDIPVFVAMYHAVEHFAMHAGQIIFATKKMAGRKISLSTDLQSMLKALPQSR